jgi:hypothetical protein
LLVLRAGWYGMALDVENPSRLRLGRLDARLCYEDALTEDQSVVLGLPAGELSLRVKTGGVEYSCVRAARGQDDATNFPVRLIEGGRFVHRFDLLNLEFAAPDGRRLDASGRLEIVGWPDRLTFILEVAPRTPLRDAGLEIAASAGSIRSTKISPAAPNWRPGEVRTIALVVDFEPEAEVRSPRVVVEARDLRNNQTLSVRHDPQRGWSSVELPSEQWSVRDDPDHLERVMLTLSNPTDGPQVGRLLLAKDCPFAGVTGMTPMLHGPDGKPTGIPVQVSKNWHKQPQRDLLYDGPWFHAFAMLRLPARSTLELQFAITYARWGGVPAASHAQLCLIGWGWNQRWDEAAIGSWGESICYEPEAIQHRCMIDDVRPLMVWSMSDEKKTKWAWTNNVGGGDFLVYYDSARQYQGLTGVRASYLRAGPNLAATSYAGITADSKIRVRVDVALARSDDLTRAFHRFRYDVLAPTSFTRLAFYQVGADHYHWHQYDTAARGDESGLIAEWTPERGGERYLRDRFMVTGALPWFSLHGAHAPIQRGKPVRGAWANRGLIVRAWNARLAGRRTPPHAAMFGTNAGGTPGANLELSPPPGLSDLQPGDFVDAEVELIIVPIAASDYYGPDEPFRQALIEGGNTWKPVFREAVGNNLTARAINGAVRHSYPLVVSVGSDGDAKVDVEGGLGYVPVTFTGLDGRHEYELWAGDGNSGTRVDQSVHGFDFWQADTVGAARVLERTYNLQFGDLVRSKRPVRLRLQKMGTGK